MAVLGTSAYSQTLNCPMQRKEVCQRSTGCKPIVVPMSARIDLAQSTVARCGTDGCQSYPVVVTRSGQFINLSSPNGFFVKFDTANYAIAEVATLGLDTYVSFGVCTLN